MKLSRNKTTGKFQISELGVIKYESNDWDEILSIWEGDSGESFPVRIEPLTEGEELDLEQLFAGL
jgi:hypothetical protein